MKGEHEAQSFVARRDDTDRGFVWRCARCGRYIGVIEALDGSLEVMHKCGARNRLQAVLPKGPPTEFTNAAARRELTDPPPRDALVPEDGEGGQALE